MDGHTPSLGWSPTIENMVTNLPEDGHSFSKDGQQLSPGWSPTISRRVTHHPKFCHPPTRGRLPTIIGRVTVPMIWSHTIPKMVTHQQYKAHHHSQYYNTFPSTVTHHLKDGQLDLEFDSSAAKLVNLVVILAQLVSLSVALPA